jgi:hypothetical protein
LSTEDENNSSAFFYPTNQQTLELCHFDGSIYLAALHSHVDVGMSLNSLIKAGSSKSELGVLQDQRKPEKRRSTAVTMKLRMSRRL